MLSETDTDLGFVPVDAPDDLGFVEQPTKETYIQNQTPTTFMSKVNSFFRNSDMEQARAMNVYALSKTTGISLKDASDNYDILRKTSKITGMTSEPEAMDFLGVAMIPAIATAAVANFPLTAAGLTAFYALDKAIPTKEFIESYEKSQGFQLSDEFKKTVELIDFMGKGAIAGGIATKGVKSAGKLINAWMEQKISEYKLPVNMAVLTKMEEITGVKPSLEPTADILPKDNLARDSQGNPISVNLPPDHPLNFKTAEEYVASKKLQESSQGTFAKPEQYATGKSGISNVVEKDILDYPNEQMRAVVFRDESGNPQGVLKFSVKPDGSLETRPDYGGNYEIFVNPEFRRKGVATQLTNKAKELGYDVSKIEGVSFTKDGLKLKQSQLTAEWEKARANADVLKNEKTPTGQEGEISLPPMSAKQTVETPEIVPSTTDIPPTEIIGKGKEPSGKERGFITSVKESEMVTKETKEAVSNLPTERTTYEVYGDKEAMNKAREKVEADPEGALTLVMSSAEMNKDVSTTGLELMRRYREQGNIEKEVAVASHLAEKATKAGQFIQAYSILDRLSPEGVLLFAQRELNRGITDVSKRITIDKKFGEELVKQATIIQETPYGYQKVKEINKLYEMIASKKGKSAKDWIVEIANVPRTLMSSFFDFSFGLRQGAFLLPSFAKEWGVGFSKQFGVFAKEKNYDALMDSIMKHPDFKLADDSGIAFTDIRGELSKLEERYMGSNIAERIPVVGRGIRATQRAYTGMANKMRLDVFSSIIKDLERVNMNPRSDKRLLREIATFVNAGTGRGGLYGTFQESASLLNAFFFSPRLMSSRLTLLNPAYYITRSPGLRKQAVKSLFGFMGLWGTMLGLAKLSGAEVGTDPRSADFGKIKINNTRIDIGAGFGQYMRMFTQLVTGKYVSSVTGKEMTLGEGYKPMTRMDILMRQIESKESPVFSLISEVLKQQSWNGEKVNIPKEVALRFVPMVIQDMYDIAKDDPEIIPVGLLTIFGLGVQTYEKPKKKIKF